MIGKNLHKGSLVQILVLALFIPSVIVITRSKTTAATSSLVVAGLSFTSKENNNSHNSPANKLGNTETEFYSPTQGPGGPILVISSAANPFGRYYAEILRAEGLNEFATMDIAAVSPAVLNEYDVVLLGEMAVSPTEAAMFTDWVNAGGTFIAFRPSSSIYSLLGLSPLKESMSDKYLMIHPVPGPGMGIVNEAIQFHGVADLYQLNGATSIATLYSSVSNATNHPAITMMNVGKNGGKAIAFTFDLARSIVYTRQGNPKWAGQKRDGAIEPIRPDDLFYPDWVDFNKIAIPQADEQQRLLANIILQCNMHRKPLPRFWYLPRDLKAVIVMTGDNHTNNGTTARFYQYLTLGPNTAQDVSDWKAVRATSYIYPDRPINNEQAVFFEEQGFEISLHTNTGCFDYTYPSLKKDLTNQLGLFATSYPGVSRPVTNRSHCLNWSDWSSTPTIELQNGIRLDATYYYWPEAWMKNRPGMFTGSGMPMRFADLDGSMIDVYQMPTQITDETNMDYGAFCNAILDKAVGPEGYYGVFCANMHTDIKSSAGSDAIIASAQARQVPVISARQMLTWLDGRNNSSFKYIRWQNNKLAFSIAAQSSANNLKAMLPLYSAAGKLRSISCNGEQVEFTIQTIKGMQYAFFAADAGVRDYVAEYGASKEYSPGASMAAKSNTYTGRENLYVSIMPNPSIKYFNMVINSNDSKPVAIKVSDLSGHTVEIHENIKSTSIVQLGHSWKPGNYVAEVIQGNRRNRVQLNKVN